MCELDKKQYREWKNKTKLLFASFNSRSCPMCYMHFDDNKDNEMYFSNTVFHKFGVYCIGHGVIQKVAIKSTHYMEVFYDLLPELKDQYLVLDAKVFVQCIMDTLNAEDIKLSVKGDDIYMLHRKKDTLLKIATLYKDFNEIVFLKDLLQQHKDLYTNRAMYRFDELINFTKLQPKIERNVFTHPIPLTNFRKSGNAYFDGYLDCNAVYYVGMDIPSMDYMKQTNCKEFTVKYCVPQDSYVVIIVVEHKSKLADITMWRSHHKVVPLKNEYLYYGIQRS